MANTLKIKRGTAATIPQGQLAEPLFTTDTYDLYIGKGSGGNQRIQNYIASGTSSQFLKGDGSLDSTTYQATSEKGQNNGYASLDSGGKVPVAQLPNSIMEYKGTWDASTNTPTLADGTGNAGDVYICSVGGTVNFGAGPITFAAGDWVVYSGSVWQKSINSNAVASVNGQTGAVVLYTDDISEDGSPTNLWFTNARARAALSATSPVQYNNSTGVISILDASASQSGVITTGTQTIAGAKTFQVSGTYVDLARFYNDTNNKSLFVYADNSGTGLSNLTSFGGESIYFNRSGTEIQFAINGSLRARLITGGRFLLGSQFYTDDGVSLLQVNGQIRAGFTAATSAATRIVTVNSSDVMETRTPAEILSDIAALPLAGGTLTGALNGTSATFTGVVQGSAIKLTNMTAGSGALYYSTGESRLTLANYNTNGIIRFETNGGTNAGTINADQTWTFPAQINGLTAQFTGSVTTPAGFYIDLNTYLYEGILQLTDLVNKKNILKFTASTSGHYIFTTFLSGGSQQPLYISAKSTAGQNVIFNTDGTTTFSHALSGTSATFSGFIGINGAAATYPLTVNGSNSTAANNTITGATADLYALAIRQKGANAGIGGSNFMAQIISAAGAEGLEIYTPNSKELILGTNAAPRLTISSTGAATFSAPVTISPVNQTSFLTINSSSSLYQSTIYFREGGSNRWELTKSVTTPDLDFYSYGTSSSVLTLKYSSGNVGIGTTNPTGAAGLALVLNSGASQGRICIKTSSTGDASGDGLQIGMAGNDAFIEQRENADLTFATNASERMRITSGGNVLVGTTTDGTGKLQVNGVVNIISGGGLAIGSVAGRRRIQHDDGLSEMSVLGNNDGYYPIAASAFNTRSDYRLKEDLKDINGLDKVSKIKVYNFKWKDSDNRMDGVLAHELEEILPYAVNGVKDAIREDKKIMPQGVDYSKLVPVLVKAIQELKAELDILKNTNNN